MNMKLLNKAVYEYGLYWYNPVRDTVIPVCNTSDYNNIQCSILVSDVTMADAYKTAKAMIKQDLMYYHDSRVKRGA